MSRIEILETKKNWLRCLCICDQCGVSFEKWIHCNSNSEHQFHSRECRRNARKVGGVIWSKTRKTTFATYGVYNVAQSSVIKAKTVNTNKKRYGGTSPSASQLVDAKRQQTLLDRYGTNQTFSSNEIREKSKSTKIERYGTEFPQRLDRVKKKQEKTNFERYGVFATFNNNSPFRLSSEELSLAGQQGYRALVNKDISRLSIPERLVGDALREIFPFNVEQQVKVFHGKRKPWLIDYYISSIDVYIEVDGIFWHGLNCDYENLHPRMQQKFDNDRKQDAWFLSHSKRLIRITDATVLTFHKQNELTNKLRFLITRNTEK